jgi:uncharacterized phiE125 gp8 family phage protein
MALTIKTAPATEPVSLDEAKLHLRVDSTDDDVLIQSYIKAARIYAEGVQNRAFVTRTYELWLDSFPSVDYIELPMPPVISLTSIDVYDTANSKTADTTLTNYFLDTKNEPGKIVLAYNCSWPSTTLRSVNGICITFVSGYGVSELVPETVKAAIKLLVGHFYEHREAMTDKPLTEVPLAVNSLLGMERIWP